MLMRVDVLTLRDCWDQLDRVLTTLEGLAGQAELPRARQDTYRRRLQSLGEEIGRLGERVQDRAARRYLVESDRMAG